MSVTLEALPSAAEFDRKQHVERSPFHLFLLILKSGLTIH